MISLDQPSGGSFGSLTGAPGDNAALAAALALKAPLASPALTGTPTGPTAATTTNTTQLATTAFVQQELNSLLDGAPAALNTLNELAAAVNDDASYAATIATALSGKAATDRKLDDFGAPDDNTDLNATTSAHGLLPKLGGGTTNFLRADGTWAAPAGGGSSISTPKVCYVSTTGNNGTAVVGNPALPFATSQAAFDAGVALAAPFRIHWYAGSHGGITVAADMAHTCTLTGEGFNASILSSIIADGAVGSNAPGDDLPGGDGSPGWALLLDSDGSVDVGSVSTLGGAGGMGGGGISPQPGGGGGANGAARLRGVWGSSAFASDGGAGGMGGGGGSTGTPGGGASVTLLGCVFGGSIGIGTGSGAAAGTVRVSRCVAGSAIGVTASSGFVTQCIGSSLSVTGPDDTGNTVGTNAHLLG